MKTSIYNIYTYCVSYIHIHIHVGTYKYNYTCTNVVPFILASITVVFCTEYKTIGVP